MNIRFAAIVLFLVSFTVIGNTQNRVQWLSWEQAMEKNKVEKRKFVVDIYTDWCGWCKKMDKATFQNDRIARYINENYYAIKLDGESKQEIKFNGEVYKYQRSGRRGYHELPAALMQGKMSYPTVAFLDEMGNVIQAIPGFQNADNFELIMTYFAGDHFKTTPWKTYQRSYQSQLAVPVKSN